VVARRSLDEEQSLGHDRAQLNRTDRHIERLWRVIADQVSAIAARVADGQDTKRPQLVLNTLNDLMATYQTHRQWIISRLAT
jgi:hypothetical protein